MVYQKQIMVFVISMLFFSMGTVFVGFAQDDVEILDECFVEVAAPEGVSVDCGYTTMPEFHGVDNGRTIKIPFIRLNSLSDNPGAPLFKTHGGPGGSEFGFVVSEPHMLLHTPILESRDVIIFNQRGSEHSQPFLSCSDENAAARQQALIEQATADERYAGINAATLACYDRLVAEEVDLNAFNSIENAADVNALREALGYDKIFYHGGSYGTMLGQHIMRDFPEILEGVILDGSLGLAQQTTWVDDNAAKAAELWDIYFEMCANDDICGTEFPNLATNLETALTNIGAEPRLLDFGPFQLLIDDVRLTNKLQEWSLTVNVNRTEQLPYIISVLGTTTDPTILDQVMPVLFTIDEYADLGDHGRAGMAHYAIACSDDAVSSLEDVIIDGVPSYGTIYGLDDADQYAYACNLINVPQIPDDARVNVPTDIPLLFMNGQLDGATSPASNQALMDFYDHEYGFTFPLSGHVQYYKLPIQPCAALILTQFVNNPTTEPDGSCIAELPSEIDFFPPPA